MADIDQQIEALEFERQGLVTYGKGEDRIAAVDEQLKYWRKQKKRRGGDAPTEPLTPGEKKRAEADGVITEAEAAAESPSNGEKVSNEIAAAHANQADIIVGEGVISDVEAAKEPTDQAEKDSNALAAQLASEKQPDAVDAHIVTEAEVAEKAKADTAADAVERPARNASTEEWRAFANSLPAPLDVGADAGRDEIVAAYVASVAPNGNASKETWMKYASDHGVDVDGKSRDEIRAAAVEAGWAKADEPPANPTAKPSRTTTDSKPRTTR